MARTFKDAFSGFGTELLEGIWERSNVRLNEAAFEERIIGIEKATAALCEAEVKDDKIISLLQKHWDLRLSEAQGFLEEIKENTRAMNIDGAKWL